MMDFFHVNVFIEKLFVVLIISFSKIFSLSVILFCRGCKKVGFYFYII